jgi:CxxC-x17-CxxC domain-containing protein
MSFQEKSIQCIDCSATFTFTAGEQEFYAARGYTNEPKRCPSCRQAKKAQRNGNGYGSYAGSREMFDATCAECGKETQVPFEPRGDKPVYCSDCYRKTRVSR